MAKNAKKIDINQVNYSIFDIILRYKETGDSSSVSPLIPQEKIGSLDIDTRFRMAVSADIKACPFSIDMIAARMSELTGDTITKHMVYSWTAETKEKHRFPAKYVPAFCEATGRKSTLKILTDPMGVFVLPGPDALRSEIQRIEEDITRKQREKKKRLVFLREIEGENG